MKSPIARFTFNALLWSFALGLPVKSPLFAQENAPASETARLDLYLDQGTDWSYSKGAEFKGAKGSLVVVADIPSSGGYGMKLSADFTAGGKYVGMGKNLALLGVRDITAFRMKIKTANASEIGIRLRDSSGQIHQTKGLKLKADGEWHDYVFPISKLSGGEHWGGANDGKWHGPGDHLFIALKDGADPVTRKPELLIADIRADVIGGNLPAVTYLTEGFDDPKNAPDGWVFAGDATPDDKEAFSGAGSLRLARTAEKFDVVTTARSPAMPVRPGVVEVSGAFKSALHSPDNSFHAAVLLECLDGAGTVAHSLRIADYPGTLNWTPLKKQVEIPSGVASARLLIQLNKASGSFHADNLSVSSPATRLLKKSIIKRLLLKTASPGNLLYPGDKPVFALTAESLAPIPTEFRKARIVVRDYWGAEQGPSAEVPLSGQPRVKGVFPYVGTIDLSRFSLETGKYYEVHVALDLGDGDTSSDFSSFAILPEAETKRHSWRDIPFSTRNWDNRLRDYFVLSDRLGIRLAGVWGTWNPEPPYKPAAPQFDLCEKLDMGVLSRTPIVNIEHHKPGYERYTEQSLREGIREFFAKYGKGDRLVKVLGNEPATTGDTVALNVANYKLMYEEIKKLSPDTFVVGTSVGTAEEYFKLGFHEYCDAVDFHTYEDSAGIKRTFERYKALFEKYGHPKPIWSTELGLNSQGLPRRTVAGELIKKFSWFFSCGGANASWFGICYPDRTGRLRGASDDSHNIFNGTWALYSPRLDAIAYYNMVNAVCIKKFITHRDYGSGLNAFLFRDKDGRNLQILWSDRVPRDVFVPLIGASAVELVRIDGVRQTLDAAGKGLTLRVGEDPVLLLYSSPQDTLPESLGAPVATFVSAPERITRGQSAIVVIDIASTALAGLSVGLPPGWNSATAAPEPAAAGRSRVEFTLTAPGDTATRHVPLYFVVKDPASGDAALPLFIPVQGQIAARLMPAVTADGAPAVELIVTNNNPAAETLQWQLSLTQEIPALAGVYSLQSKRAPAAYFSESPTGALEVATPETHRILLPLANVDPLHSYQVQAVLTDKLGRVTTTERFVAGFVSVPRATPTLDGKLDDAAWSKAAPRLLNEERQFRHLLKTSNWNGPADLSAQLRFLWDDTHLYVGVQVTDDHFHNDTQDGNLWAGDSLQFIIDPWRAASEKPGKYDYGMALTNKGPQAWCFLSADARAPAGEARDIVVTATRATDGTGGMTYEVAIPWIRLAPFTPEAGANLGLAFALNEDDTPKRDGFMAWFGDIQSKEVTPVGDLILEK